MLLKYLLKKSFKEKDNVCLQLPETSMGRSPQEEQKTKLLKITRLINFRIGVAIVQTTPCKNGHIEQVTEKHYPKASKMIFLVNPGI